MKKILLLFTLLAVGRAHAQTFEAHTPKVFAEILTQKFDQAWTPATISAIENRAHIVIMDADAQAKALRLDDVSTTTTSFNSKDQMSGEAATYQSALLGMFQIIDINSNTEEDLAGQYRIHPALNSYAALNADGTDVVVTDAGSYYVMPPAAIWFLNYQAHLPV